MIMETQQHNLFSSSSPASTATTMSFNSDTPIIRRAAADDAVFGWGDFPVWNDEYTVAGAFASSSLSPSSCSSEDKLEWSSTPPSYIAASSSSDDTSPSLALSVVSSSDDDDDDDDDTASNYSDESESFALTSKAREALLAKHALKTRNGGDEEQRHVRFASVIVQEHEVVLGDHPWAGPYPLALGWKINATHEYTLDNYELERRGQLRRARSLGELPRRLSAVERCQRLFDVTGCSLDSLQAMEKKRQFELENQTYPMHDDEDDETDTGIPPLCFQDKMRQLPADFYTTIVPAHERRKKSYGTIHFF
jgi:hypothetical protein